MVAKTVLIRAILVEGIWFDATLDMRSPTLNSNIAIIDNNKMFKRNHPFSQYSGDTSF